MKASIAKSLAMHYCGGVARYTEDVEDGTVDPSKVRMSAGTIKACEDERHYRGWCIQYDVDSTYERWVVGSLHGGSRFETLREAKAYLDDKENER